MSRIIVVAPQAEASIAALAERAGHYAAAIRLQLLAAIYDKVRLIELQPEMYPAVAGRPQLRRCVVVPRVVLYYRLTPTTIEIVDVVDSRRDPSGLELL